MEMKSQNNTNLMLQSLQVKLRKGKTALAV